MTPSPAGKLECFSDEDMERLVSGSATSEECRERLNMEASRWAQAKVDEALERAAKITCGYCRDGMTPTKSNKADGIWGHYFEWEGTEEGCGEFADAIRAMKSRGAV